MTDECISPLRRRMIEDMTVRNFVTKTQTDYIRRVKNFAVFLGRAPDTASREDVRRYLLHLASSRMSAGTVNGTGSALRFLFDITLDRPEIVRHLPVAREPRKAPVILSPEEVARMLEAARGLKYKAALSVAYGDDGVIVAGHGRVMAARKLGLSEAPVIVLSHLTPVQRRALMIADNQITSNSGWNDEMLAAELAALKDEAFDLELLGFDDAELDRLLAMELEPDDDADDAPKPPAEPVSRPGDLWICGEHRVLCGNATVLADVEKVLAGELADMCFTDSPYNVDYANSAKDKLRGKSRPILNDNLGQEFGTFLYDACVNILTVTKGAVYICMSSSELDTLQEAFRKAGGKWSTFVIWAKNTFTLGRSDYQRQYEPILYGWKDGSDHYCAAPAIRATSGSSTSRIRMICTRP